MIFDTKQNKGMRCKFLQEPNPTKVELSRNTSLFTVFEKSIELYYKEFSHVSINIMLADSAGNLIEIQN